MSASGEVYSKYKRGPRTDPCGTPRSKERCEDRQLLTLTNCERDVKYDFSQESTVPLIPNRVDSLDNKMERSRVSKAADKSSRSRKTQKWNIFVAIFCFSFFPL